MRWRSAAFAFVIIGLLTSSAASVPSTTASTSNPSALLAAETTVSAAAQQTLRVGIIPISAFLDLYIARENGWFQEEGLSVEPQFMSGGAEIQPALIGGALDIGITNQFSHVLARDQGFDIKAIAGPSVQRRGSPQHGILVRADSPIQSARDLEGRTMATNTLNNIDHLMQQVWLQRNGADPRRVNFVEIPFPQSTAALMQGRVDAIGPAEPFTTVAQMQGARLLANHYTEVNELTGIAYYAATGDWLARNGDTARRFANVIRRSEEYLMANPEERRAAIVRHLNLQPDVAARVGLEEWQPRVDPTLIQWWIDTGRSFGLVNSQLNPADFIYETVR